MNHTPKKLLFVLRHAPYGNSLAKEALDAILASSAYDQTMSILFMDDGVLQLIKNQHAGLIEQKSFSKILDAFELYDINQLFVCAQSLTQRGIKTEKIANNIQTLPIEDIQRLMQQQDHILSF